MQKVILEGHVASHVISLAQGSLQQAEYTVQYLVFRSIALTAFNDGSRLDHLDQIKHELCRLDNDLKVVGQLRLLHESSDEGEHLLAHRGVFICMENLAQLLVPEEAHEVYRW